MNRKRLKQERAQKKLTQEDVAKYLSITVRAYQRLESGETLGSITHWDKLEDLFNVPQRALRG